MVIITTGKVHDVNILDQLSIEPGAIYVMDRGYLDFARLYKIHQASAFFVTRAKRNFSKTRLYSRPVDKTTGVECDQIVILNGHYAKKNYLEKLRRIRYVDSKSNKTFVFLTNNFVLPAITITDLYRYRWQVELFFKWIKQHLRIKSFYRTTENAVKTQIDMDSHLGLCSRSLCKGNFESGPKPLHNSTDFKPYRFRKRTIVSSAFKCKTHYSGELPQQPVESIRLTLGQQ